MPSLLDAQLELWHHTLGYIKAMALKAALDLCIADAIHHHGGAAMLAQIAARVALRPSRTPCLRRLMRVLTVTGVFSTARQRPAGDGGGDDEHSDDASYGLTPASRLLVGSPSLSPFLALMLDGAFVSPFLGLGAWLQQGEQLPEQPSSLFEMAHGKKPWDLASRDPAFGSLFNDGMVADSGFIMDIVVKECGDVFRGLTSLVDVAAQAISKAFPSIKCSVLDLPHIVADAPAGTDVKYIAGDMFESIPPGNAIFLKVCYHFFSNLSR